MFGIIEESKKFILLDSDHDKLRVTALMLAKEIEETVTDYDEDENVIGEHVEKRYVPMFDEDTVDEAIKEYTDEDIEVAYNGESWLKGFAPKPSNEYQSERRAEAYAQETDPITAHINRLKDEEQTEEIVAEIEELKAERSAKVQEIKERFPYYENSEI